MGCAVNVTLRDHTVGAWIVLDLTMAARPHMAPAMPSRVQWTLDMYEDRWMSTGAVKLTSISGGSLYIFWLGPRGLIRGVVK